jgi:hypothetical protein
MNIADSRCSSPGQQGALGEQWTLLSFTLVVIVLVTLGKANDQQHVCHWPLALKFGFRSF